MSTAPIGTTNDETVSARGGAAVTKSDSTVFTPTRALWVGGTGDVVVTFIDGTSPITLSAVPAGTLLPIEVTQVLNATTATLITALR